MMNKKRDKKNFFKNFSLILYFNRSKIKKKIKNKSPPVLINDADAESTIKKTRFFFSSETKKRKEKIKNKTPSKVIITS
jgi:hypothetical protein